MRGGLSVWLSQKAEATQRWRFQVFAETADGTFPVGVFQTCPPHHGSEKSRLVATAAVPGARAYTAIVTAAIDQEVRDFDGVAWLSVGEPAGQLPGLIRVGERARYRAGNGPGVQFIPAGERVIAWSAFSTGAGASVAIDAIAPNGIVEIGDVIPIPAAGGVRGGDGGLFEGPLTFTFATAAIGGWLIETAESA